MIHSVRRDVAVVSVLLIAGFILSLAFVDRAFAAPDDAPAPAGGMGVVGVTVVAGEPMSNCISAIVRFGDVLLYGTSKGIYVRPLPNTSGSQSEMGSPSAMGSLAGCDTFVTALVVQSRRVLIGTSHGLLLLERGLHIVPLPSRWSDPFIASVVAGPRVLYAGGPSGLIQIDDVSSVREITLPDAGASAPGPSSLTIVGSDLLVSLPRGLYLFHTATGAWSMVSRGVLYHDLIGTADRWIGRDAAGSVEVGGLTEGRNPSRLPLPENDAATALAWGSAPGRELLVGTFRGRVIRVTLGADGRFEESRILKDVSSSGAPVRSLLLDEKGILRVGRDGAGASDIDLTVSPVQESAAVSSAEPSVLSSWREEEGDGAIAPGSNWRATWERVSRQAIEKIRGSLPVQAAVAVSALVLLVGLALRSFRARGPRESRRSSRAREERPQAPPLELLSEDIAEKARRLQSVSSEIHELSREATRGLADESRRKAREASIAFVEIETWMQGRLEQVTVEQRELTSRLAAANVAADTTVQDELQQRLYKLDCDARYLRFVLEE